MSVASSPELNVPLDLEEIAVSCACNLLTSQTNCPSLSSTSLRFPLPKIGWTLTSFNSISPEKEGNCVWL